jgi:cellulose synthase/poly-beta-1,6-N-acetylglucosamine synthase-like glycosyltransferase
MMSPSAARGIYLCVCLAAFAVMNALYAETLAIPPSAAGLLYCCILEFVAFGYAIDLIESTFALFLPVRVPPRLPLLSAHPPVALVRCICDDVDLAALAKSQSQQYPNLRSFVLDDSTSVASRRIVDALDGTVVRRTERTGYKAGNINHWMSAHGSEYRYVIVLDSDSVLPVDFVSDMVAHAEHPANRNIALFDSLILPWNEENEFVRIQAVAARLICRRRLRVENNLETTLSMGHNTLLRTEAIQGLGGIPEAWSAEDQATSLELYRTGQWRCATVPVQSYERLPSNLAEYARRKARYAFQTCQLMTMVSSGLSWTARVKLLRQLHSYMAEIMALVALVVFVAFSISDSTAPSAQMTPDEPTNALANRFVVFWVAVLIVPLLLRIVTCLRERISMRQLAKANLFESAIFAAVLWPVFSRLMAYWVKGRAGFEVTGRQRCTSLVDVLKVSGPGLVVYWLAALAFVANPSTSALNLLWIAPTVAAPAFIYFWQVRTHG